MVTGKLTVVDFAIGQLLASTALYADQRICEVFIVNQRLSPADRAYVVSRMHADYDPGQPGTFAIGWRQNVPGIQASWRLTGGAVQLVGSEIDSLFDSIPTNLKTISEATYQMVAASALRRPSISGDAMAFVPTDMLQASLPALSALVGPGASWSVSLRLDAGSNSQRNFFAGWAAGGAAMGEADSRDF